MRKIILSEHTSLDGFVAGRNGEMGWIKLDNDLFDFVGKLTNDADTALYGRKTWQMMENYWPTAANQPNATKHDIEHSRWYNKVDKVVISRTMQGKEVNKTIFVGENLTDTIYKLKERSGRNILIFGSPSASHSLMAHNLIDEYWLFVNPVLLGEGISLFSGIKGKIDLKLLTTKVFPFGVVALNYAAS